MGIGEGALRRDSIKAEENMITIQNGKIAGSEVNCSLKA
jgi:hypothetical protein